MAIVLGFVEKIAYAIKILPRHKQMIEMGDTFIQEFQVIQEFPLIINNYFYNDIK